MINHVCVKNGKCFYYEERAESYIHIVVFGKFKSEKKGVEMYYYCKHPKKLKWYESEIRIFKKPVQCGLKVTSLLDVFIDVQS